MYWRDLLDRRWLQLLERMGGNRGWLGELGRYYRGMTEQELWARYTVGRMDATTLSEPKPPASEADHRSLHAEPDYRVLRQMYHHRHSTFHWIARALRGAGRAGDFCEYGSGVAPVTAWLRSRLPGWRYTLVDLPSPMLDFARWRFRGVPTVEMREAGLGADLPLTRDYDGIACLEVLEHVVKPLQVVRHLAEHVKPGGSLFLNFAEEPGGGGDLAEAAAERGATIEYLNTALEAVRPLAVRGPDVHRAHYVRPRH